MEGSSRIRSASVYRQGAEGGGGGRGASCDLPDLQRILSAVESEVIPRLLARRSEARIGGAGASGIDPSVIERLSGLVLESDLDASNALVTRAIEDGASTEAIYLGLLAPTARHLGEMWEQDRIGFLDVTLGLCHLHRLIYLIDDAPLNGRGHGQVLLAPVPGETHMFGTLIVARLFGKAGWSCWTEVDGTAEQLVARAREKRFDVVALSISCDHHERRLGDLVAALHGLGDEGPLVLVGGPAVSRDRHLAERVGADLGTDDVAIAIERVTRELDKVTSRD